MKTSDIKIHRPLHPFYDEPPEDDAMDRKEMKLLPCPFCGGEAVDRREIDGFPMIYCNGDNCFGPQTTASSFEDALVQWNTRAAARASAAPEEGMKDETGSVEGMFLRVEVRDHSGFLLQSVRLKTSSPIPNAIEIKAKLKDWFGEPIKRRTS